MTFRSKRSPNQGPGLTRHKLMTLEIKETLRLARGIENPREQTSADLRAIERAEAKRSRRRQRNVAKGFAELNR